MVFIETQSFSLVLSSSFRAFRAQGRKVASWEATVRFFVAIYFVDNKGLLVTSYSSSNLTLARTFKI
jgi:hypothetical protein